MECVADFEGIRKTGCDRRIVGWVELVETNKSNRFVFAKPIYGSHLGGQHWVNENRRLG